MTILNKIADFARQVGTELSEIYFDEPADGRVHGTEKEWKEFLDSGRRPGDGFSAPRAATAEADLSSVAARSRQAVE